MQRWLPFVCCTALATSVLAQTDPMDEEEMDEEMIEMTRSTGKVLLGVDVALAKVRGDQGDRIGMGIGGDAWVGYEIPVGNVGLIPRFKFGYHKLLKKDENGGDLITVYPGFSVAYHADNLTPWIGIGLGVGSINQDVWSQNIGRQNKFGFEIAAGLGYSVSPTTSVGAFVGYDIVATDKSTGIVMFGLGPQFAF